MEDSLGRARVVIGAPLGLAGYEAHQSGSGRAMLSPTGGFDRLTALVTDNGSALVKVSAPGGQERATLLAKGDAPAQLIVHDSATKIFKNVMPKP